MNERIRMAYLDALGIDSYVSRRQLPGAAVTQRMAIPARYDGPATLPVGQAATVRSTAGAIEKPSILLSKTAGRARIERIPDPPIQRTQHVASVPRFSLVSIVAGDWLWLEDLGGMPLTTEQVQLVQAMARALLVARKLRDTQRSSAAGATLRPDAARPDAARPDVMQFDWPIHSNRQLDQGEEAARAGVAGFLARRLEQSGSCGLVLLGQTGAARVPVADLSVVTVCTASSADMLENAALKPQAWRDLLPLIRSR